uniref:helix-turn-helix transcriptional regulator n=1 Tax=Sphingomonas sp. GlSt437 TaxID=3389970 RepID=UPI003A86C9CC
MRAAANQAGWKSRLCCVLPAPTQQRKGRRPPSNASPDAVDIAARSGCYRTLLDERQYLEVLGPVSLPLLDLMPDEREFGGRGIAPGDRPSYAPIAPTPFFLRERNSQFCTRIKEGLSNRDIAARHRISEDTVKWHVHNIFSKLEVRSRVQAILRAEDMRILE